MEVIPLASAGVVAEAVEQIKNLALSHRYTRPSCRIGKDDVQRQVDFYCFGYVIDANERHCYPPVDAVSGMTGALVVLGKVDKERERETDDH